MAVIHSLLPKFKHSTVQSIAFYMRKNAPMDDSVSKSFPGVDTPGSPLPRGGDLLPDPPPARPMAVWRGASAPDVETSAH